ncbi:MAG: helix-turn-helix domain-containing protein [Lentisphaeria bacterium]|nr:helix-turn-helix domain-containing protein [Lentisphaeria bacterium]
MAGILNYAGTHEGIQVCFPNMAFMMNQQISEQVDGVIGPLGSMIPPASVPVVDIGGKPPSVGVHVTSDETITAQKAFYHFYRLGLRNMAVLDTFRLRGVRTKPFVKVCEDNGFVPFVFRFGGPLHRESRKRQDERLIKQLRLLPKPAGLFLTFDSHFRHILGICKEAEIRVPEDLVLLGCNNDLRDCLSGPLTISSIDLADEQIGYQAMKTLVAMINGEIMEGPVLIPPGEVISRETSEFILDENPNLTQVLDFMHKNMHELLVVDDLVAQQISSRRTLEKQFADRFGLSASQYLRSVRLKKACYLLETTGMTVKDIAKQCGFTDSNYLCRVFRKQFGASPIEYKKRTLLPY